jgi:hypothetical protein
MKEKIIKFVPLNEWAENVTHSPDPSKKHIPEWYRKMSKTFNNEKFDLEHFNTNLTMKACVPILDSMIAGYMITLPVDLVVKIQNGIPLFTWMTDSLDIIEIHKSYQVDGYPIPDGYSSIPFKFRGTWRLDTPPGYSIWYTHPTHRFDLPFYTLTGFVDSDKALNPVNFPFFIKDGWEGVIEKGTPIAQAIPIKRESWSHEILSPDNNSKWGPEKIRSKAKNYYRNLLWEKKKYS